MGRIGDFFRKVGRGIKKVGQGIWTGVKWVGNNVGRPVANIIANPASQALLSSIPGPYGKIIGAVGGAVHAGINIMDGLRGPKQSQPPLGQPPPPQIN
jgi:phage-related protein